MYLSMSRRCVINFLTSAELLSTIRWRWTNHLLNSALSARFSTQALAFGCTATGRSMTMSWCRRHMQMGCKTTVIQCSTRWPRSPQRHPSFSCLLLLYQISLWPCATWSTPKYLQVLEALSARRLELWDMLTWTTSTSISKTIRSTSFSWTWMNTYSTCSNPGQSQRRCLKISKWRWKKWKVANQETNCLQANCFTKWSLTTRMLACSTSDTVWLPMSFLNRRRINKKKLKLVLFRNKAPRKKSLTLTSSFALKTPKLCSWSTMPSLTGVCGWTPLGLRKRPSWSTARLSAMLPRMVAHPLVEHKATDGLSSNCKT